MLTRSAILVFAASLVVLSCEGSPAPPSKAGAGVWVGTGDWQLEPDEIFAAKLDDTVLINSITSLRPGPDGLLYVTMRGDARVSVLTRQGALVRRIGTRGEGPGEFAGINGFGWRNDSLWVMDAQLARLSWFDPGGAFLGSQNQQERDLRPTITGDMIGISSAGVEATARTIRFKARDSTSSTILRRTSWSRGGFRIPTGSGSYLVGAHPLNDAPHWALHPSGRGLVLLELPPAEGPVTIHWFSASGQSTRSGTIALETPTLTPEEWERFLLRFYDPPLPPEAMVQLHQVLRKPERWPPVSGLVWSEDDHLWIRGPSSEGANVTWTVLDSTATRLGSITLPATLRIVHVVADTPWTIHPNADDLDVVTRYLLRQSSPARQGSS